MGGASPAELYRQAFLSRPDWNENRGRKQVMARETGLRRLEGEKTYNFMHRITDKALSAGCWGRPATTNDSTSQ